MAILKPVLLVTFDESMIGNKDPKFVTGNKNMSKQVRLSQQSTTNSGFTNKKFQDNSGDGCVRNNITKKWKFEMESSQIKSNINSNNNIKFGCEASKGSSQTVNKNTTTNKNKRMTQSCNGNGSNFIPNGLQKRTTTSTSRNNTSLNTTNNEGSQISLNIINNLIISNDDKMSSVNKFEVYFNSTPSQSNNVINLSQTETTNGFEKNINVNTFENATENIKNISNDSRMTNQCLFDSSIITTHTNIINTANARLHHVLSSDDKHLIHDDTNIINFEFDNIDNNIDIDDTDNIDEFNKKQKKQLATNTAATPRSGPGEKTKKNKAEKEKAKTHQRNQNNMKDCNETNTCGEKRYFENVERENENENECQWMRAPDAKRRRKSDQHITNIKNSSTTSSNGDRKDNGTNSKCDNNVSESQNENEQCRLVKHKSAKVFLIRELLIDILQFLHIYKIIEIRRINYIFDNISKFTFSIDDNILYFDYVNVFIKTILERDICDNIQSLGIWYIQTINLARNISNWIPQISNTTANGNKPQPIAQIAQNDDLEEEQRHNPNYQKTLDINNCKILETLYCQIKNINEKTNAKQFMRNNVIGDLLLGNLYGIIPLTNKLLFLLDKNESFQSDICFERFTPLEKTNGCYIVPPQMVLITDMIGIPGSWLRFDLPVDGYVAFFFYTAMKGNFSLYSNYLRNVCSNDGEKISKCGLSLHGIFGLICLFLRDDLMDDYVHYGTRRGLCDETIRSMIYLVEPKNILIYKESLKNRGVPMNKDDEFEFDLINNPRYNPYNRVMMLRKLCFSSNFGISWQWILCTAFKDMYVRLRKFLLDLYYNFDFFQSEWHLNEYDDFRNDISKQKELYSEFKVIIQVLLGFSCYWYQHIEAPQYPRNIVKAQIRRDPSFYNITLNDEYKFVDVNPQSETEFERLYNIMNQDSHVDTIKAYMEHPQVDRTFEMDAKKHTWTDVGESLKFVQVTQPHLLFYKMCKISHT